MSTHSTMPLRASERKKQQRLKLRRQSYIRVLVLFALIFIALITEIVLLDSAVMSDYSNNDSEVSLNSINLIFTKSFAIGAILNWLAQTVFAIFVFRFTGAQSKNKILTHLYLGQIIKWFIVIAGFSIIFMTAKSISTMALIFGFLMMQLGHFVVLWLSR